MTGISEVTSLPAAIAALERHNGNAAEVSRAIRLLKDRLAWIDSRTISINRMDFEIFREVQVRHRKDWPASFSTNLWQDVWPFVTRGSTPDDDRQHVRGMIPKLDEICHHYLLDRSVAVLHQ
jgi:hypothetical protein